MASKKPNKLVVVGVAVLHLSIVTLTWRDLSGRSPEQIRGNKTLWRIVSGANTGGAVAYWLIGRRR